MQFENVLANHGFSIGTDLFADASGQHLVLPFRRSVVAILVLTVVALIMTAPAVITFSEAVREWRSLDTLFDLVGALFLLGWLLGWSAGLLVIYALLTVVVAGRETLVLRPGCVEVRVGLPFLFVRSMLDPGLISGLQHWVPKPGSGTAWRGPHLVFDYDGRRRAVGSDISKAYSSELAALIRASRSAASGRYVDRPIATREPERNRNNRAGIPAVVVKETSGNLVGIWTPATLALLVANLVPIAGVLFLQWELGTLMVLFWAESGIIGLYNLVKIGVVQRWLALLTGPFFIGHFGAFMAIHFLFVYELFVARETGAGSSLPEVGRFFYPLWPALIALLFSHGVSFMYNFLGRREYRDKTAREQMSEPYRRVVIMHVTLIIGGGLSLLLGSPVVALLLLVMLKIAADIHAHRQQRRR